MNTIRKMKSLKIKILSWLLNQANRETRSEYYYKIKNVVLAKYGTHIGYDVQFIEGKKCHSCDGSGVYTSYRYWSGRVTPFHDTCYNCFRGWYKRPVWNILAKIKLGKFSFHQPYQKVYENPTGKGSPIIEGYIEHNRGKHGKMALHILYLCYERGYLKRYWKETGNGWRVRWWYPSNWLANAIHIIKKGRESMPARDIEKWLSRKPNNRIMNTDYTEDLPF